MKKTFGKLKYWLSTAALTGFFLFSQTAKAAGDATVSDFTQLKAALADPAVKPSM